MHEEIPVAFQGGQFDEIKFVHPGEHRRGKYSVYEWDNVSEQIEPVLLGRDNKALTDSRRESRQIKDYYQIDPPLPEELNVRTRDTMIRRVHDEWCRAGYVLEHEFGPPDEKSAVLVLRRMPS
ncbi:hypothetical protein Q7P37_005418 [Cladosporium fusiforme]